MFCIANSLLPRRKTLVTLDRFVAEPEKLQIIQQYLKSSANTSARHDTLSAGTFFSRPEGDQENDTSTASVVLSDDQPVPRNSTATSAVLETETEGSSPSSLNSTRYCDDCLAEEVCVAIVDEPVPICRIGIDREDPTGCAGFCLINKQKCHRLDVDAFRSLDIFHSTCLHHSLSALSRLILRSVRTGAWKWSITAWTTSGRAPTPCASPWRSAATGI